MAEIQFQLFELAMLIVFVVELYRFIKHHLSW